MMLAGMRDWLFWWQWAPVLAMLAFWMGAGPYLFRRALTAADLPKSKRRMGRCLQLNFLVNVAGLAAMGMVALCAMAMLGKKIPPRWLWILLAAVFCPIIMFLMSWAVAAVMLALPGKSVLKVIIKTVGPMLLVGVICAAAALVPARSRRIKGALRGRCMARLVAIQAACQQYGIKHPLTEPESLDALVEQGFLDKKNLYCPARDDTEPGYLYAPSPMDPRGKTNGRIRACDRRGNHDAGRLVLFSDGVLKRFTTEEKFQKLLELEITAPLAEAGNASP